MYRLISSIVLGAAIQGATFAADSASCHPFQPILDKDEVALVSSLAPSTKINDEFDALAKLKADYVSYRDNVKRVQALEEQMRSESGSIFDAPAESAADVFIRKQKETIGLHQNEPISRKLKQLSIPGPAYRARFRLQRLIGTNKVRQVDSFLHVSPETARFIETGNHVIPQLGV